MQRQAHQSKFRQKRKTFDKNTSLVETLYGDDYSIDEIKKERECIEYAYNIGLGPKPINMDLNNKRLVEQFFTADAIIPPNWTVAKSIIENQALPALGVLLSSSIITIDCAKNYNSKLITKIEKFFNSYPTSIDFKHSVYVKECINKMSEVYDFVPIGMSHGDLKFDHVFQVGNSTKFIDWDSLSKRSIYFDYFNLIGPWLLHHKITGDIREDILGHLDYITKYAKRQDNLSIVNTESIIIYLVIFLFERICRVIDGNSPIGIKHKSINRQIKANQMLALMFV